MSVHNHGPEEGPGLAYPERIIDGKLVGECLAAPEPTRESGARTILVNHEEWLAFERWKDGSTLGLLRSRIASLEAERDAMRDYARLCEARMSTAEASLAEARAERAWLVEAHSDGFAQWWTGAFENEDGRWEQRIPVYSDNPNAALRLARREDAEACIAAFPVIWRRAFAASEHLWDAGASPTTEGA